MSAMACLSISTVRADAVFVSRLQRRDEPSAGQVRQAVAAAIRALGCSGCTGGVAQEFGDHPETAVYLCRPGTVVRCRNCSGVLMVISQIRGVNCVDIRGLTALDPHEGG